MTSLNSVSNSLSYDIVRFKIKVGVDAKFICKNVTRNENDGHFDGLFDNDVTRQPSFRLAAAQGPSGPSVARAQSVDAHCK